MECLPRELLSAVMDEYYWPLPWEMGMLVHRNCMSFSGLLKPSYSMSRLDSRE